MRAVIFVLCINVTQASETASGTQKVLYQYLLNVKSLREFKTDMWQRLLPHRMFRVPKYTPIVHSLYPCLLPCFCRSLLPTPLKPKNTQAHKTPEITELNVLFRASYVRLLLLSKCQLLMGALFLWAFFPAFLELRREMKQSTFSPLFLNPFFFPLLSFPRHYLFCQSTVSLGAAAWLVLLLCQLVLLILSFFPLFLEAPEKYLIFPPFTSLPSHLPLLGERWVPH